MNLKVHDILKLVIAFIIGWFVMKMFMGGFIDVLEGKEKKPPVIDNCKLSNSHSNCCEGDQKSESCKGHCKNSGGANVKSCCADPNSESCKNLCKNHSADSNNIKKLDICCNTGDPNRENNSYCYNFCNKPENFTDSRCKDQYCTQGVGTRFIPGYTGDICCGGDTNTESCKEYCKLSSSHSNCCEEDQKSESCKDHCKNSGGANVKSCCADPNSESCKNLCINPAANSSVKDTDMCKDFKNYN